MCITVLALYGLMCEIGSMNTAIRKRSPRFPGHSLEETLSYARRIYDAVHRSAIDSSTAFEVMGFAGKSGSSATALGSVRQYDLVEGFAENTRISDLALQIFEPASVSERDRALRKAAFAPKVFEEILERFAGKIPSVDEPIRAYLIRDLGFSKGGAEECIGSLRRTIAYLPEETAEDEAINSTTPSATAVEHSKELPASQPAPAEFGSATQLRFPLSRECYAELTILGEVTPRAIVNLKRQIDLLEEFWSERD